MNRSHTATWIALLLLTAVGFLVAERWGEGKAAVALIISVAGLKFGLVAWWFMELREAPRYWPIGLFGLVAIILGMSILLA